MQSNTVVLQGTSYPICLVAGKGQTPSGYAPAVANTAQSAKQQIAESWWCANWRCCQTPRRN